MATYGFKHSRCTGDVVHLLRTLLTFSPTWSKALNFTVIISSQDVATAFGSMDHDQLKIALLRRGMHPRLFCVLLRELTSLKGRISIPGAGTAEPFNFASGGKQGGVETPGEWNFLIEHLMDGPLVQS